MGSTVLSGQWDTHNEVCVRIVLPPPSNVWQQFFGEICFPEAARTDLHLRLELQPVASCASKSNETSLDRWIPPRRSSCPVRSSSSSHRRRFPGRLLALLPFQSGLLVILELPCQDRWRLLGITSLMNIEGCADMCTSIPHRLSCTATFANPRM
ncbi:hypothetical protein TNCV_458031 [Trichonephila clavipes]|nr:hypothetical protein TNCV_458031 [Trichonephila clavipes]